MFYIDKTNDGLFELNLVTVVSNLTNRSYSYSICIMKVFQWDNI
jgi:hypothetical protein